MHSWRPATDLGPTFAVTGRPAGRRLLAFFLTDLIASVFVVLMFGWLMQASASDDYLRDAMVTQNDIYISISRFTPHNLVVSYVNTILDMNRSALSANDPGDDYAHAVHGAVVTVALFIVNGARAVPYTMLELFRESSGFAAWIVLAGFAAAVGSVFVALLSTGRSPSRLMLGIALTPFAVSAVFLTLQGFMVAMLYTFYWFTSLAPYTVACPVLCTVYWIAFPNAERGATATVAHGMLRMINRER